MRDAGVATVAMEVSSHALAQHRVDGTRFAAVCFTNLSHDHLDYHGDVDAYFEAKARLFTPRSRAVAAVNVDDAHGRELADRCRSCRRRRHHVRGSTTATPTCRRDDVEPRHRDGTDVRAASTRRADRAERVALRPARSASTSRTRSRAAATARASASPSTHVVAGLGTVERRPGPARAGRRGPAVHRARRLRAHARRARRTRSRAARELAGAHRVIVVFGCGGDRDRAKRPLMGEVARRAADVAIVTSDNPRSERPGRRSPTRWSPGCDGDGRDVAGGARPPRRDPRRARATPTPGDVVVIAGKGHETGQTADGVTVPFDDRAVAREELGSRAVELTAREIAEAVGGEVVAGSPDAARRRRSRSTRVLAGPGACFVALRGARDGHDFVADAFARGATDRCRRARSTHRRRRRCDASSASPTRSPRSATLGRLARTRLVARDRGRHHRLGRQDRDQGPDRGRARAARAGAREPRVVQQRGRAAAHAARRARRRRGRRRRDGRAVRRATSPTSARSPARRSASSPTSAWRTPSTSADATGIARGEGRAARGAPGRRARGAERRRATRSAGLAARTAARVAARRARRPAPTSGSSTSTLDDELRPRFVLETPWGSAPVTLALRGEHQVENAAMAAAVALALGVPLDDRRRRARRRDAARRWRMELVRTRRRRHRAQRRVQREPDVGRRRAAVARAASRSAAGGSRCSARCSSSATHADAEHEAIGALAAAARHRPARRGRCAGVGRWPPARGAAARRCVRRGRRRGRRDRAARGRRCGRATPCS